MKIVLASGSPRRRELFRLITEDFEIRVSILFFDYYTGNQWKSKIWSSKIGKDRRRGGQEMGHMFRERRWIRDSSKRNMQE